MAVRWLLLLVLAAGCSTTVVKATSPATTPAAITAAERLQACESAHGLTSATEKSHSTDADGHPESTIRGCSWPAAAGAEADGYEEVTVTTVNGPGDSESSDATDIDEVTGTCSDFQLRYHYAFQGDSHEDPPIEVPPGSPVDVTGARWTGDLGFYPDANVGYVVHNGHVGVDAAGCT